MPHCYGQSVRTGYRISDTTCFADCSIRFCFIACSFSKFNFLTADNKVLALALVGRAAVLFLWHSQWHLCISQVPMEGCGLPYSMFSLGSTCLWQNLKDVPAPDPQRPAVQSKTSEADSVQF